MKNRQDSKNAGRLRSLGMTIAMLRKRCGLSQAQLAERAAVSRSLINAVENAESEHSVSLDVYFRIADAMNVDPACLLEASALLETLFMK